MQKDEIEVFANKVKLWSSGTEKMVSNETKERAYKEFNSKKTLYVYCDCSMKKNNRIMSIASTYVHNQSIVVTQKEVYPPIECINKNIYGEISALLFALTLFGGFLNKESLKVVFYSDVNNIKEILDEKIYFNNNEYLRDIQSELILGLQEAKARYNELMLEITYLHKQEEKQNPFAKRSHNAARRMLIQ